MWKDLLESYTVDLSSYIAPVSAKDTQEALLYESRIWFLLYLKSPVVLFF